jgi:signal transduction histidine kinase
MASLLETAQALLGEGAWQEQRELSVELALERLLAAFLLREFDDVEARALLLLARPLPAVARLVVEELRVRCCLTTGDFMRGTELGVVVLAAQGEQLPMTEQACLAAYLEELAELERWFERTPDVLDRMPLSASPEDAVIDGLWVHMGLCAAFGNRPMLFGLTATRAASSLRRRGTLTPTAPFSIDSLAMTIPACTGDHRGAARWVGPAVRIAERIGSPLLPQCLVYQGMCAVYFGPAERQAPFYEQAIALGLKSGSFQGTSWGLCCELLHACVWRGTPLAQLDAQRRARSTLMQRAGDTLGKHIFGLIACWCELLVNPSGAKALLGAEPLARGSRALLAEHDGVAAEVARTLEAFLFLIAGEHPRALSRAREAEEFRPMAYGMPHATDIPLWLALAAAKCWDETTDAEERARLLEHVQAGLLRVRYFAEGSPECFLHKQRLIEAELARIDGRVEEALAAYGEAVELARQQRFLHIEAISAQLAAECHLAVGHPHEGALYMREAREAYERWGALAVVAHLENKHPELYEAPARRSSAAHIAPTPTMTTTSITGEAELDADTAVRAAQVLSGELDAARVVARLMELALENAGAQKGALVLRRGDALVVVARLSATGTRIATDLSVALADARGVATTVVQYAARTQEPVVLGDAEADTRFGRDAHLRASDVRSVLALPLSYRGRLGGVLYLEHASPGAFSAARVAFCSVLTAQGAIALENASLYAERQREEASARFLAEASRRLVASLDPDATLRCMAEIPLPELCDACVVCTYDEAEQLARPVGAGIPEAAAHRVCEALRCDAPAGCAEPRTSPSMDAVREAVAELDLSSWVSVSLVTRERRLGVLCLLAREEGRFDEPTRSLAEELGRRAALALDNARLYCATQRALQMLNEFLAVASHELRTPLTSMRLMAQHLEQSAGRQEASRSGREARAIAVFRRQTDRLTKLVDQLLNVSRIEAGQLRLELDLCDLTALARNVLEQLEAELAQAGCAVTLMAPGAVYGRWDGSRVEEVLLNLLTNAMKHGAHKPITLSVQPQGAAAEVCVEDQGVGISRDDQGRIFERFERAAPVQHHRGGLGLGLYISRQIVLAHGGTLRVESEPGHGARFIVRLPLEPADLAADRAPPPRCPTRG